MTTTIVKMPEIEIDDMMASVPLHMNNIWLQDVIFEIVNESPDQDDITIYNKVVEQIEIPTLAMCNVAMDLIHRNYEILYGTEMKY